MRACLPVVTALHENHWLKHLSLARCWRSISGKSLKLLATVSPLPRLRSRTAAHSVHSCVQCHFQQ